MPFRADVAVVGAGPAGCVIAARMAQLGFAVTLIERAPFPRRRLGESLTPGVMPMLASVGLAGGVRTIARTAVTAVSSTWSGEETVRRDPSGAGMLVDRGAFDAALLAEARNVGVRTIQPGRVSRAEPVADGWRLHIDGDGIQVSLHAAFIVDATGRAGVLRGHRRVMGPRTLALYRYWIGARLPRQPRIEAHQRMWCWGVPLPDGSFNTLVFVDGAHLRAAPRRSLDEHLTSLLAETELMRDVLHATPCGPTRAVDATPYVNDECVGARYLAVGDTALALDPLSSSGVQKAIQTALSGAIVANTLLRQPHSAAMAQRFYRDRVVEAAEHHRVWAAEHYQTAAAGRRDVFWRTRAGIAGAGPAPTVAAPRAPEGFHEDDPIRVSLASRWEATPCLGAEFVELRPALRHPGLDGPVAYVGGAELATLLRAVHPGITVRDLARMWAHTVPAATGRSILRWLIGHGVLERAPAP